MKNTLFTNVALTKDRDVWWEGKDGEVPEELTDWQGRPWKKGSTDKAAHPNSRFTAPAINNPALSKHWDDPQGVPISAIIFGGRRASTVPLVVQSFNWTHGVYFGATMGSETTAAATGKVGVVRRDPMAMLPFCGYNMGDYFAHWLEIGASIAKPPRIFRVNWFRTNDEGKFLWPGFGDNLRVLKWILERCESHGKAVPSAIGPVPTLDAIDRSGLEVSDDDLSALLKVDPAEWVEALAGQEDFFRTFGDHMPPAMWEEQKKLAHRIEDAITPHDLQGRDLGT